MYVVVGYADTDQTVQLRLELLLIELDVLLSVVVQVDEYFAPLVRLLLCCDVSLRCDGAPSFVKDGDLPETWPAAILSHSLPIHRNDEIIMGLHDGGHGFVLVFFELTPP